MRRPRFDVEVDGTTEAGQAAIVSSLQQAARHAEICGETPMAQEYRARIQRSLEEARETLSRTIARRTIEEVRDEQRSNAPETIGSP